MQTGGGGAEVGARRPETSGEKSDGGGDGRDRSGSSSAGSSRVVTQFITGERVRVG